MGEQKNAGQLVQENRQLRKQNECLKRQREILKKAMSILGEEATPPTKNTTANRKVNVTTRTAESKAQSINHEDPTEWLQTRPGVRCLIRIPTAATNSIYSVVEIVSDSGDGTPVHVHQKEDEHFVILEGTARIVLGNKTFDAAAGTSVTLSRGIPHAWSNPYNSPLRMLVLASPGGCEEILRLIAKGGDFDLTAISQKFGIRTVGPALSS